MVVVEQLEALINKDQVKNKPAYLFLAQAQYELGLIHEAQSALNALYGHL